MHRKLKKETKIVIFEIEDQNEEKNKIKRLKLQLSQFFPTITIFLKKNIANPMYYNFLKKNCKL